VPDFAKGLLKTVAGRCLVNGHLHNRGLELTIESAMRPLSHLRKSNGVSPSREPRAIAHILCLATIKSLALWVKYLTTHPPPLNWPQPWSQVACSADF